MAMQNFKKIINPCLCNISWTNNPSYKNAYCKITYENGRLSITGVIGPKSNGDCWGSAGQCIDDIRNGSPKNDWNYKKLVNFCDIWKRWHLNDMRPYCEHQAALGWPEIAGKKVNIYHYTTKLEVDKKIREIKKKSIEDLAMGKAVQLSENESKLLSLKSSLNLPYQIDENNPLHEFYEPRKKWDWNDGPVSEKALGWLKPDEHPDGILTKPCPVCGYEYGSSWKTEPVPENVLEWLYNLPDTTIRPAWV